MPRKIDYCIYGLHSGDGVIRYVGRSKYGYNRLSDHRSEARRFSTNMPVHKWMRAIGVESAQMQILERLPDSNGIAERELFWMQELGTFVEDGGLNVARNGWGGQEFSLVTDKTRLKMKQSALERIARETDEQRDKRLAVLTSNGRARPFLGKKHRPESISKANQSKRNNGTWPSGGKNGHASLKDSEVLEIFASEDAIDSLAKRFAVSRSTVHSIKSGKTWAAVTGANRRFKKIVTPEQVVLVRNMHQDGLRQRAIADSMGLSTATICNIINAKHHFKKEE